LKSYTAQDYGSTQPELSFFFLGTLHEAKDSAPAPVGKPFSIPGHQGSRDIDPVILVLGLQGTCLQNILLNYFAVKVL